MRLKIKRALRPIFLKLRYPQFDRAFYLNRYADIADAGIDPLKHYHEHGKFEGRQANARSVAKRRKRIVGRLVPLKRHRVLGDFSKLDPNRKTILIVLHQTDRTGAPIIGYNLIVGLLQRYNVVVLALEAGTIAHASRAAGAVVIMTRQKCRNPKVANRLIEHICRRTTPEFAIVNSVEARCSLPGIKKRGMPAICLIHEFAANTRPKHEFLEAVQLSDEVIFPAAIVRENAWNTHPELAARPFPVIPQGLCAPPVAARKRRDADASGETSEDVRTKMGMGQIDDGTIVIVAVGYFSYRKGPDLFVQCASRIVRKDPKNKYHFVWVGKGYEPETNGGLSAYIADQIVREDLSGLVHFAGELENMDAVYEASDIMLLTSRLDPLPCVCTEAAFARLPFVCFDRTTGFVEFLADAGLDESCIAKYLNVDDMSDKVIDMARSRKVRDSISAKAFKSAHKAFDMDDYVRQIEQQALRFVAAAP